jgi:hypothetical protein
MPVVSDSGIGFDTASLIVLASNMSKDVFKGIRVVVQKWSNIIETEAKAKAPVDRGQLASSINSAIYAYATEVVGTVGTNLFYGFYQHEGTKPHWIPFYNPPTWDYKSGVRYPDLIKWARRHGLPVDGKRDSKGKWIQKPMKGMYVRGIANPFIKEAFEKYENNIQADLQNAFGKVVQKYSGNH